jgi:hypothetical protein
MNNDDGDRDNSRDDLHRRGFRQTELQPPTLAAVVSLTVVFMNGRGERIRTSDLSVPNRWPGKNVSYCLFKSCSHHRFTKVFTFRPIRYCPVYLVCWEFWSQISHIENSDTCDMLSHSSALRIRLPAKT